MKSPWCLLYRLTVCVSQHHRVSSDPVHSVVTLFAGGSWSLRNQAPIFIPKSSLQTVARTVLPGGIPSHLERAAKTIFSSPQRKGLQGDCTKPTADVQTASLSHPRKLGCCSPFPCQSAWEIISYQSAPTHEAGT